MTTCTNLIPRYRLYDESHWLEGVDPCRNYWLAMNSDPAWIVSIPGLYVESFTGFRQFIVQFRELKVGETLVVERVAVGAKIHCVAANLYAIESLVEGAIAWHLFDFDTLEALLMTAHPDWQCSVHDVELGRQLLMAAWLQAIKV